MNKIIGILFIGFIIVMIINIVIYSVQKSEKNECKKWQSQSQEFPKFYSTDWQKDQCNHYGIKLNK
jgi:hypothetical protein